tara:strand:- start:220 stop:480 length:261 start_codon:yes stop_codon:yes gene_type:complete
MRTLFRLYNASLDLKPLSTFCSLAEGWPSIRQPGYHKDDTMPIKTFLASLTLSLIVGCAGQTTQDLPSGWSVVPDIGVFDFSHRVN